MPNRHCHQCGTPYPLTGTPGRSESCEKCRADLHVCLNCTHYALSAAHQCRERRAEPVGEKGAANFCEWFEFALRDWTPGGPNARADEARKKFQNLFGD